LKENKSVILVTLDFSAAFDFLGKSILKTKLRAWIAKMGSCNLQWLLVS
jgi:hypothetical protein